jgi:hypothetical protein
MVRSPSIRTARDAEDFKRALDTHTWEAAAIVEKFAADWYSKYNWQTHEDISRQQVQGFVARGLRKLRSELRRRAEPE